MGLLSGFQDGFVFTSGRYFLYQGAYTSVPERPCVCDKCHSDSGCFHAHGRYTRWVKTLKHAVLTPVRVWKQRRLCLCCGRTMTNGSQRRSSIDAGFRRVSPPTVKEKSRAAEVLGLNSDEVFSKGRQERKVKARSLFCLWALRELGMSHTALAKKLEMSVSRYGVCCKEGGVNGRERQLFAHGLRY